MALRGCVVNRVVRTCVGISLAGSVCVVLLAGCAVGPDYHPQQTAMPQAWASPATQPAASTTEAGAELTRWWKTFHDPKLDSLIERAVQSNLDLKSAVSRVRQARASRGVAFAGLWPTASAGGSYARHFPGGVDSRGNPIAGNAYQAGLDAAWELDVFGGTRRSVESADAGIQFAIEDQRGVLVSLLAEVALNYAVLRGSQQQIRIAENNLQAQRHSADLTRQRQKAGFVTSLDVANADASVASTASVIPVLEVQARQSIYALSVLLGQPPGALVEELSPIGDIPAAPAQAPQGLPSELLRRRPDIRQAEAQIHAATANIGVATADLFPKFSLSGAYGSQTSQADQFLRHVSRVWSFGPGVNWEFFSAGRTLSNIEVQKALQEQSVLAYTKVVLTALGDVESALVSYTKEFEHYRILEEAFTANQKAVEIALKLYTQGQTDFLNVLSAQRSLFASEEALWQSRTTLTTDLIALYKALGGGWEETDSAPARAGEPASQPASAPAPIPASSPADPKQ
jgi:outer membrane protein, multidrug efflux system